ncbi:hypothetical protein B0J11DRAFT_584245 [Dendryphion nanum]|uniref:SRR1-like domain-containing protein n=1 Tax=Dendryphion nanum TaxID=256645 RepID=A0A9P9DBZ7_9PLEO|nr:hypothetical protein B0J11DRAFT_584245 [Dendryphion nanum]
MTTEQGANDLLFDFDRIRRATNNEPIFTRERFEMARKALLELEQQSCVTIEDIFGEKHKIDKRLPEWNGRQFIIEVNGTLEMAEKYPKWLKTREAKERPDKIKQRFCPFYLSAGIIKPRYPKFSDPNVVTMMDYWREVWDTSVLKTEINTLVEHLEGKSIKKIITVGSGSLGMYIKYGPYSYESQVLSDSEKAKPYIRHEVADQLGRMLDVPVYHQDPRYELPDVKYLAGKTDVKHVLSAVGSIYTLIDEHTLVIANSVGGDLESMIELAGENGPAAIICPDFKFNAEERLGQITKSSPRPWGRDGRGWMSLCATGRMLAYREKCTILELKDEEFFGFKRPQIGDKERVLTNEPTVQFNQDGSVKMLGVCQPDWGIAPVMGDGAPATQESIDSCKAVLMYRKDHTATSSSVS